MSFLPPWVGLLWVLLLLGALAAWMLRRGLSRQASALAQTITGVDVQAQAQRQIQQQHLVDLDVALAEGRLDLNQHGAARDELLRQVLVEQTHGIAVLKAGGQGVMGGPVRWGWMALMLAALSGLSYLPLGAPQAWRSLPLSQRVQISATSPEQWAEQTRVWQEATQKRPDDAEAWLTLARLQAAQNAHAQAEQALARVLALSPELDLWIERAQMKARGAGDVYTGEPWQWIENVLREQPQHLNALVLAGSAALSEQRYAAAQTYWQQALNLVPAESEAAQGLQQALTQAREMAQRPAPTQAGPTMGGAPRVLPKAPMAASDAASGSQRPLIQGEVRVSAPVQSQMGSGATLFVYALAEEGSRRPVAIWRGTPTAWPVAFTLNDSMGMGAPPLLSDLPQVRLVARISKTGAAQRQPDDWQVELPGVKTGVQGVVLNITGR
jgi:cytochrome c-type biogenesis protein CcmH